MEGKCEDTTMEIRIRKSKENKHYNGQKKKQQTNNGRQHITQKTKDWAILTPL